MKILVVCQHFYPETFRISDICFELAKRGNEVTVLTGLPNYPKGNVFKEYRFFRNRKQIVNGVKIIRCSLIGRKSSIIMMAINYAWFTFFGCLKALFMNKDFDIVYTYQLSPITMVWPGIVVKKIKKIPLVIHCLDQWPISVTTGPISKSGFIYKLLKRISIKTYIAADKILIGSKSFKDYFENELHIQAKDKGLIYYPSYAEDEYKDVGLVDNNVFDILFAGNIGPAQSVETIIETANLLKDVEGIMFHIVGDGLSRSHCEDMTKEYKLENVVFYGFHDVVEMPKYYAEADCFIITMVNNEVVNSTLPAKVQSYMLAGKPIVGAINGEVKTVVEEARCGYCCASGDAVGLSKLILKLSKDKAQIAKFGGNALAYYEMHFEKEKCISDLEALFEKTMEEVI